MGCSNSRNHHDVESDCDDGSLSSATDPLSHDADRKRPPRRQSRRRSAGPRPRETRADTRREQYRAASAANTPQAAPLTAAVPGDRSSQRSAGRTSASRQSRASPSTASPLDPQLALLLAELDEIKAGSVGDLADEPSAGVRRATEADIVTRAFAEHGINTDVDQFAALHAQHRGRNQKARVTEWLVAVEVSNRGVTPQDPALAPPLSPPTSSPGQRTLRSEVVLAPLVNFPSSFAFSATPEQGSIVGNSTFMLHSSVFAMNQSELTLPGTVADTISQVSAMSDALPPAQKGHQQRSGGGQRRAQPLAKPATFVHRLPIPSPSEREDHPDDDVTATYR